MMKRREEKSSRERRNEMKNSRDYKCNEGKKNLQRRRTEVNFASF
jgi:hypothetical protein